MPIGRAVLMVLTASVLTGCTVLGGSAGVDGPVTSFDSGNGNSWDVFDECAPPEQVAATAGFGELTLSEDVLFLATCLYVNEADGDSVTVGFFPGVTPAGNDLDGSHEGMIETATPTLGTDAKVGIADGNCIIALPGYDSTDTYGMFSVAMFNTGGGSASYCDPLLAVTQLFGKQRADDPSEPMGGPTCEEAEEVYNSTESDATIEAFAQKYFDGDISAVFDYFDTCGL